MFDCLRELSDIIAHYERLSLRFQEEMDQLPPGCLLTRTLKNAERFYHQFRLEGKTKQVYLNAGAAARPVSYTHLDVYKRQSLTRSSAGTRKSAGQWKSFAAAPKTTRC